MTDAGRLTSHVNSVSTVGKPRRADLLGVVPEETAGPRRDLVASMTCRSAGRAKAPLLFQRVFLHNRHLHAIMSAARCAG